MNWVLEPEGGQNVGVLKWELPVGVQGMIWVWAWSFYNKSRGVGRKGQHAREWGVDSLPSGGVPTFWGYQYPGSLGVLWAGRDEVSPLLGLQSPLRLGILLCWRHQ